MDEEVPKLCQNCRRDIPSSNYQMHVMHCQRNIQLCPKCDEPVPRSELENHNVEFHSNIKCPECHRKLESSELNKHKEDDCPKRAQPCQYCNLELKAEEILAHEDYCGSRTEPCEECGKLVMFKFQQMHLTSDHRLTRPDENPSSESDRDDVVDVEEDYMRLTSRNHRLNPPSSRRSQSFRNTARNNRFGEDLGVYFQNMELDRIRNATTTRVNARDRTGAVCPPRGTWEEETYIPCEFCDHPIPASELVLHQTGCRPDLASVKSAVEDENAMNEFLESRNGTDSDSAMEDVVLIPCEFCKKSFSFDSVNMHQIKCQHDSEVQPRGAIYEY